jgi:DNA-binding NarL/FixJ family response regulator
VRVGIADDSALFREGLKLLLESQGVQVPITAANGDELVARVAHADTLDAVIVDMRMPPNFSDEGLQVAVDVHERHPRIGILVLSTYAETVYAAELLERVPNSVGYLLKDQVTAVGTVVDALTRIVRAESVIDAAIVRRLFAQQKRVSAFSQLTEREREVLGHMAQGRSNAGIAHQLNLSIKTVEQHIANILLQLDVKATADDNKRVLAILAWLRCTSQP